METLFVRQPFNMPTDFHRRGQEPELKRHRLMERDALNTRGLDLVFKRVYCIISCDNGTREKPHLASRLIQRLGVASVRQSLPFLKVGAVAP